MLKRYQILLDDWLADFAKGRADRFDTSFSEIVRLGLCIYYGTMISENYPNFKFKFTPEMVASFIDKAERSAKSEETKHKLISDIYFETRKAMEYYLDQRAKSEHPGKK